MNRYAKLYENIANTTVLKFIDYIHIHNRFPKLSSKEKQEIYKYKIEDFPNLFRGIWLKQHSIQKKKIEIGSIIYLKNKLNRSFSSATSVKKTAYKFANNRFVTAEWEKPYIGITLLYLPTNSSWVVRLKDIVKSSGFFSEKEYLIFGDRIKFKVLDIIH